MKAFYKESRDPLAVADLYDEGLSLIGQEKYALALSSLLKIEQIEQAPPDTVLYILWARLKLLPPDSFKKQKQLAVLSCSLDSCPLSLRFTPLFWYVRGLVFFQAGQWEKAELMMEKSLRARPDFKPARQEWRLIRQKRKVTKPFMQPVPGWFKQAK